MLDSDTYLVQRNGTSYNVTKENANEEYIAPDDLLLVNRDGVNYSITGALFLEEGGGGGEKNPDKLTPEENAAVNPDYLSGTGTLEDPFVITAGPANLGGQTFSDQLITIYGLRPDLAINIIDTQAETNGVRYLQPTLIATNGYVNFRMEFFDHPETTDGGNYSSILNIGEIYWQWDVTVLPNGVQQPHILEILGQDGAYHVPIQGPDFTPTPLPVSEVIAADLTGLTPDITLEDLPTIAVTGTGTGLTVDARTDTDGAIRYIIVKEGGSDYLFGDEVTVDLSALNGDPVTPLTIYTAPVSAPSITFRLSPYTSVESGEFLKQEWWIGTDPSWAEGTFDIYDVSINTDNPTVVSNLPTGSVYFAKVRYLSQSQVYSAWSATSKGGMFASYRNFSYILSNQNLAIEGVGGNWQSFESPDISIDKIPGTYFTYITQDTGIVSQQPKGAPCNNNPTWGANAMGQANGTNAQAVWIQIRNPINLTVTGTDAFGAVESVDQANFPIGLPDYFINRTVTTTTNGTGTGYKFKVTRVDGITTWLSTDEVGAGYAVGDTITFKPPFGNGGNGNVQTVAAFNQGWTDLEVGHSTLTMDSEHDILLHGIGSSGGAGGTARSGGGSGGGNKWYGSNMGNKGVDENNGNNPGGIPGVAGVITPNDIYPGRGDTAANCSEGAGYANGGGGSGGAGWGDGKRGGQGLNGSEFRPGGGGGGSGYSLVNPLFLPDVTTYGSTAAFETTGCYLLIGGAEVTVDKDFFYKLY